ncbi:MAG: hypothetical protein ABW022_27220 [Actinoplanes sp.]
MQSTTYEVIAMWLQPPPPVDDRWVLHIAATPHEVDDILVDLYIHKRAHPIADPDYPAYLAGRQNPDAPPAWMTFARAELERRGHRTRWCDSACPYHPDMLRIGHDRADRRPGV